MERFHQKRSYCNFKFLSFCMIYFLHSSWKFYKRDYCPHYIHIVFIIIFLILGPKIFNFCKKWLNLGGWVYIKYFSQKSNYVIGNFFKFNIIYHIWLWQPKSKLRFCYFWEFSSQYHRDISSCTSHHVHHMFWIQSNAKVIFFENIDL